DGVAHRRTVDVLDAGDDEADFARFQRFAGHRFRREVAELVDQVGAPGGPHADLGPGAQRAIHDAHQRYDADVVVEPGVDDERLQRRIRVAPGRRHATDQLLEQLGHVLAGLGADAQRILRLDPDDLL